MTIDERPDPPTAMADVPADLRPSEAARQVLGPVYALTENYSRIPAGAPWLAVREAADDAAANLTQFLAAMSGGLDEAGVQRLRELAASWDARPVADCGPWTCARELLAVLDGGAS